MKKTFRTETGFFTKTYSDGSSAKFETYIGFECEILEGVIYTDVPTLAQLSAIDVRTTDEKRADILNSLASIDLKSVRSLREGDTARLASLEAEATALREELNNLTTTLL